MWQMTRGRRELGDVVISLLHGVWQVNDSVVA
jgi:hypothetical protein